MFEALGVSPREERLYVALVDQPWMTPAKLQQVCGLGADEVADCLASMEALGLVSRTTDEPLRLVPAPPDVAVEALIARQTGGVEQARSGAAALMRRYRDVAHPRDSPRLVEVMSGQAAVRQRFQQLLAGTSKELLVFDKPPYAIPHTETAPQLQLLEQDVTVRTVYEHQILDDPEIVGHIETLGTRGEQARVLPTLPLKLAIADRRIALVPLTPHQPPMEASALVHPCALLDALIELFDVLWQSAVPLVLHAPGGDLPDDEMLPRDRQLLGLMLTGMTDRAIARQLDVTVRTISRRVAGLMDAANSQTRFQLGWQAARRGWI